MGKLNTKQRRYLEEMFGSRVSFNKTERKLYGHDTGEIPRLIKPLMGSTVPEAVVQPETESELLGLVAWALNQRVPLTPRGKATSGYGGVLPVKGGVVVDFYRMKKVVNIDRNGISYCN